MNKKLYKSIRNVWQIIDFKYYWGSNIDVRYKLVEQFVSLNNKYILDVGGAPGVVDYFLEKNNFVVCVDINRERLFESKRILSNTKLVVADWNNLPFKEESFDIILLVHIIELFAVEYLAGFIKNLYVLLKSCSKMIITTPNRGHLYYINKNKLDFNEITSILKNYDYDIKPWNPFPPFPFFPPNQIVHKIPFIWKILEFCFENKYFLKKSQFFYIELHKKQ